MSEDIPVTFSTNAPQVTPQIQAATGAIDKAANAHDKFQGHVGRTEKALAKMTGRFGHHIESMLHLGGVLGTVGIAFFALEKVLSIVEKAVEKHDKKIEEAIKAEEELEKQVRKTTLAFSERGLAFGKDNGGAIKRLTASGGLDLAKQYTLTTGSFAESAKATEEAQDKKFKGRSADVLKIAARVSNVTGESLSEVVKRMTLNDVNNQSYDKLTKEKTGKNFYQSELAVERSGDARRINANNRNAGSTELQNIGLISQSGLSSGAARAEQADPTSAFQVKQFQERQQSEAHLEEISRKTGLTNFLLEKIVNAKEFYLGAGN